VNAIEILRAAKSMGVELLVVDGVIRATPPGRLNEQLKTAIRERKTDLIRVIGRRAAPSDLDELRRLWPLMWRDVVTVDGRRGLLWSISPYGVVVSFGPGEPLYTLSAADVFAIENP